MGMVRENLNVSLINDKTRSWCGSRSVEVRGIISIDEDLLISVPVVIDRCSRSRNASDFLPLSSDLTTIREITVSRPVLEVHQRKTYVLTTGLKT